MAAKLGGGNDARGWQLSFAIYGVAAVAFFLIAFAFTRERVTPPKQQTSSMWKDLGTLGHNRPWIALVFATLVFILFVATRGSVSVHYFKYYVGEQQLALFGHTYTLGYEWTTSIFNGIGQVAAILGALFTAWFATKIGKKPAFMIYFTIAIVCTASLYPLRPDQLMAIYWLQIAGSFTGGSLSALIWAMYADAADFGEWKTGRRATGLIFSASTMSQKIGWAFGGFVAGILLSAVGFEANKAASPEVQHGLRLMMSLIPAGFGLLAMGVMLLYRLNDKKVKGIEADLFLRRKESGEEPAS
jgi:GPH family glycoside/pentoside/hexuronide:cation symporter